MFPNGGTLNTWPFGCSVFIYLLQVVSLHWGSISDSQLDISSHFARWQPDCYVCLYHFGESLSTGLPIRKCHLPLKNLCMTPQEILWDAKPLGHWMCMLAIIYCVWFHSTTPIFIKFPFFVSLDCRNWLRYIGTRTIYCLKSLGQRECWHWSCEKNKDLTFQDGGRMEC